jgi:ketosteroid isomerase-like protein
MPQNGGAACGILLAMSQNLDLVRSIYAAWEQGDFSSFGWADPEIEYVVADGPAPGTGTGLEQLRERQSSWTSVWDRFRIEVDEYRELDDGRVLVLTRGSGRGRTSGLEVGEVAAKSADVFHLRDGRVTSLFVYYDRGHALADLGLEE